MTQNLNIYFSNHLEILYQNLKKTLYTPFSNPFTRRLVIVYGPAMKSWLTLKMAQDPDLGIAAGIEFIYLNQAFEILRNIFQDGTNQSIPSSLELELMIEKEIVTQLNLLNTFDAQKKKNWMPLIHHLKFNSRDLNSAQRFSAKTEKRLIGVSRQIAKYFKDYGRFAGQLTEQWNKNESLGWQEHLWQLLFNEQSNHQNLFQAFKQPIKTKENIEIHFFSISFLARCEFDFMQKLSGHLAVNYYMISPCAVFWSDIRSDKESRYLLSHWEKKKGEIDSEMSQLEELLADRNPLLANFGRMGREMVCQIEESTAKIFANYILPSSVQQINDDPFCSDDLYYFETAEPLTLLQAVQADILLMRNPQNSQPLTLQAKDASIQLHRAPNKRREIEITYHNLIKVMDENPDIEPRDILVMAPKISDYVPYIQQHFGSQESQIECQILDLGLQSQSEIVQSFMHLLDISESRWDASHLMELFEKPSFQRKHQFTQADYHTIREWVDEAGIRWGDDSGHRNELLQRKHCSKGMNDETYVGTWDFGLSRLLMGLTCLFDADSDATLQTYPCNAIDFTETELLGKWMRLLHALRDDLLPLQDGSKLTIEDWTNYLKCLLESYFQADFNQPGSLDEYKDLLGQFETIGKAGRSVKEAIFPFQSIKIRLNDLLQQSGIVYRENYLQSVRFCSLIPLRSIPAKVIVLLGMHEGAFPRVGLPSSLNLMVGQSLIDYCPSLIDYDRYLFLEALHSAQNYLLISYQGYDSSDSKELKPSLIVEELFSYLDRFYLIGKNKPSEICCYCHPLSSFDKQYFLKDTLFNNFSRLDFKAAQILYHPIKQPRHLFVKDFKFSEKPLNTLLPNGSLIDIKHLSAVARDPIKFYLSRILGIYLQDSEDRLLKTEEELSLSALDRSILKKEGLKGSRETFLHRVESEGKLPFGMFKTVAINKLTKDIAKLQQRLKDEDVCQTQIFEIEFCTSCQEPVQINERAWLLPAITLTYPEDYRLHIVGKLMHATPKGLFAIDADHSLEKIWRAWPHFLVFQYAARHIPQKMERNLILSDFHQSKVPFFDDPEPYLKHFIRYYGICHTQFSPLMPKWITHFQKKNAEGLQKEMEKVFDSFSGYQSPTLQWIFNKDHLPNALELIENWSAEVDLLTQDIIKHWK
jgi:exodeoxyribonuclease V gamma subunit